MPETLTGLIERVTFHNPENGFAVLKVQVKGRQDLVTVVGSTTSVSAGEHLEATGKWVVIEQEMVVNFEGRQVQYDFGDLDEIALAYVLSIHKSQGSEFPCVVIPLHTQHYMMLQRNLLYTAVTRGKKLVVLVGTKKALGMAVRRQDTSKRFTALRKRLQGV